MYDLDTNSYIRGGWSWDIYHNPFMNLFIAGLGKVWANAWFIVGVQCLGFALCAAFFWESLFARQAVAWQRWLPLGILALEPVTTFYNYSLLAESFYIGFTLVAVAAALRWLKTPSRGMALFFGLAMGLTFLCKLSAIVHLPLFGIFLLRGPFWKKSVLQGTLAFLPFLLAYIFVFVGQKSINKGDLYTVEGRVRWDFSSALYNPTEIEGDDFKRLVHPHILKNGVLVAHRELRRELSYLGYKDCVAEYEARGQGHNRGVNACDSLFGAVAGQVIARHFWAAERQFVADNFRFVHELSYLDYRFTPDLYYYHPQREWQYLDSLVLEHYDLDLLANQDRIPVIWKSMAFGNVYMPLLWWAWWLVLIASLVFWLKNRTEIQVLAWGLFLSIPLLFHLVYISYRPRFLAPYLILVMLLGCYLVFNFRGKKTAFH